MISGSMPSTRARISAWDVFPTLYPDYRLSCAYLSVGTVRSRREGQWDRVWLGKKSVAGLSGIDVYHPRSRVRNQGQKIKSLFPVSTVLVVCYFRTVSLVLFLSGNVDRFEI